MVKYFRTFQVLAFYLLIQVTTGCSSIGVSTHNGLPSDHFDGDVFFNPWMVASSTAPSTASSASFFKFAARRISGADRGEWPEWVDMLPGAPPPARVTSGIRITFVGHATLLIQTAGVNILTDPVWSHYIGPSGLMSVERYKNAGIRFEDLPEIDAVIISHNHYDHFDLPTLRRLKHKQTIHGSRPPRIFVPLGNAAFLSENNIQDGHDLDWWQNVKLSDQVSMQAVPAQHWSTRALVDRNRVLWAGYVLHTPAGKVYFAGDTGYGQFVHEIRKRIGPIRIALLPIGAYLPNVFRTHHINPAEAVKIHKELQAEFSIPMHFGTFRQSSEAYEQPLQDLKVALEAEALSQASFAVLKEGEAWEGL